MEKIVLTIDVEDWFCVRNMRDSLSYERWDECEQRIDTGLDFVLAALQERGLRATFFILGWIAERHPASVRKIASHGHEIASHGYNHQTIDQMSPAEFERDLQRSLKNLTELCGRTIRGYRAPSFSITEKTYWALDVLERNGIAYDSSIYPIHHPNYGIPSFPERLTPINGLVEVPLTTARLAGMALPISGGGYFRLYPYAATRKLLRGVLAKRNAIMYFHPWEFDPQQPRNRNMGFVSRFRHYTGLRSNRAKFTKLLDEFEFCTMGELLAEKGFDIARRG